SHSVLSPGVRVDVGAVVRDSIVMFDSVIRAGAVVDRAILDKQVSVGPNAAVGEGTDYTVANRQEPTRLNTGITVVGKRALIPRGVRIGRNVKIAEGARANDFRGRVVRSGQTIERHHDTSRGHDGDHAQTRPTASAVGPGASNGHTAPAGIDLAIRSVGPGGGAAD
ncbi:MAG: hypothetical protein M0Z49_01695, partial [Chloroflexi bacterium]|nr:hypothetical protein [Chloroflexota bacterium]